MFDIGFLEIMVVAILGLLVLGPERLPHAARSAGLLIGKIRRTMSNVQDDLERHARTEELREKLKDPYATFIDDDEKEKIANSDVDAQVEHKPAQKEAASNKEQMDEIISQYSSKSDKPTDNESSKSS